MATNFTGSDVIAASDVTAYQTDAFDFGIGSGDSEVTTWLTQTTNDILRDLRIKWWPVYKTNVYTDITVLNTAEMSNTRFLLPALTKFRSEADKDRFERMIEFYTSAFAKEFQSILDDGVEYDSDAGGTIAVSEKEPLHAYNRLNR